MLTAEQRQARQGKLTGSRVGLFLNGSTEDVYNLWREMMGDPNWQEPDLSGNWAVQLGTCTEQLNLDWYERKTDRIVTRRGEVVAHLTLPWAAATLDGWDASIPGPVEAKYTNSFALIKEVIDSYLPQIHWQILVTGTDKAMLSVIMGTRKPIIETIALDKER